MNRIVSFAVAVALVFFNSTVAFAHTAVVENEGQSQYKAIRITPEIYNGANKNLSDILVKNDKGETLPYFINSSYQMIYKGEYNYPMILSDYYQKDSAFYFDYKVEQRNASDIIATSIKTKTSNSGFAKKMELFGSYDGLIWTKIQNDSIYKVDEYEKTELFFEKPQKFSYYRFKLSNNLEKISFNEVVLHHSVTNSEKGYFVETIKPDFEVVQDGNVTKINILGLKHLKLAQINIQSDSVFKRRAVTAFKEKEIYNLKFGETVYNDTSIALDSNLSMQDIFWVHIMNQDDKPINISGVTVQYYADELVFDGASSEWFAIAFGAADVAAPKYDIASYKEEVLKQEIDHLTVSKIQFEETKTEPKAYDFQWLFNIVIIITALLLGVVMLLRLKKS